MQFWLGFFVGLCAATTVALVVLAVLLCVDVRAEDAAEIAMTGEAGR